MTNTPPRVIVIGAGPAGVRATQQLVAQGLRPTVIDEAPAAGGQIYRQPPTSLKRPYKTLYGLEAAKAKAIHTTLEDLKPHIDYRPETLAWDIQGNRLFTNAHGQIDSLDFDRLIIASGATDRVIPVPGWLTPGTYTLGGAQVALKAQAMIVGDPVVLMGCGPLLYLIAYQYARVGAHVAAVLDTSPRHAHWQAFPKLLAQPDVALKGAYYLTWLRARRIPLHRGVTPVRIEGDQHVQAIVWQKNGQEHRTLTQAVALGYGLRSETQLADLAGCAFTFDTENHQWLPKTTHHVRSSRQDVYLAGDGARILGADAAELTGRYAALTLLKDSGHSIDPRIIQKIERKLARQTTLRQGLEQAFPFPRHLITSLPDDTVICRCEEISLQHYREQLHTLDAREMNRAKAFTRVGMGRCQGRMCGIAAAEILAHAWDKPVAQVGRLRGQAPVKPLFVDTRDR